MYSGLSNNSLNFFNFQFSIRFPNNQYGTTKVNKKINIQETSGTAHYSAPMRADTAPFDNNDVRTALKLAIDREDFLKRICHGYGTLGNDHSLCPAYRYYAKLPQRMYDPDKAKFHLDKAGMSALDIDLSADGSLGYVAVSKAAVASASRSSRERARPWAACDSAR